MHSCVYEGRRLIADQVIKFDGISELFHDPHYVDGEEVYLAPVDLEEVRSASARGDLTCCCCHERVSFKAGTQKAWHFAHYSESSCSNTDEEDMRPESAVHFHTKYLFAKRLKQLAGKQSFLEKAEVDIEVYVEDAGRMADVLLTIPREDVKPEASETKIAFEIQCTPISKREIEKRDRDYSKAGITAVWILTGAKHGLWQDTEKFYSPGKKKIRMRQAATYLLRTRGEIYHIPDWTGETDIKLADLGDIRLEVLCAAGDYYAAHSSLDSKIVRPWKPWHEHFLDHRRKRTFVIGADYHFSAPLTHVRLANRPEADTACTDASSAYNSCADSSCAEASLPDMRHGSSPQLELIVGSVHQKFAPRWRELHASCTQWPRALKSPVGSVETFVGVLKECSHVDIHAVDHDNADDEENLPGQIHQYQLRGELQSRVPLRWIFDCDTELWQRIIYLSLIYEETSDDYRDAFQLPRVRLGMVIATGFALTALSRYIPAYTRKTREVQQALNEVSVAAEQVRSLAVHGKPPKAWDMHKLRHLVMASFLDHLAKQGVLKPNSKNPVAILDTARLFFRDVDRGFMGRGEQRLGEMWQRWHDLSEQLAALDTSGHSFEYTIRRIDLHPEDA
ncbi:MAG: hypothetical protein GVY12_13185 [Bacteroidetes bacterium]|jgi:hypothetical protein|nr:hypothetical protein [Bacteroidota bacterium]